MIVPQKILQNDGILTRKKLVNGCFNTKKVKPLTTVVKMLHPEEGENAILASLPINDYRRIEADLEIVNLKSNNDLYQSGDTIRYVYFPVNSVIYQFTTLKDGATIENVVVGSEGVLGVSVFFGETETMNQARLLSDAKAIRISSNLLKREFDFGGALHREILHYSHKMYVQGLQTAACNRLHNLKQKLCRWLLMTHDRIKNDRIDVTQEFISQMLGTRRPYITAAVSLLQKQDVIRCSRGYIEIFDRRALEDRCCECYETMK